MKKKNVWVLTVFFGFVICYMLVTSILEDKLKDVAYEYVDDATTCFAESADVLFEYYKNSIDYIDVREILSLKRSELTQITDDDIERYYETINSRISNDDLQLAAFIELVDGKFVSSVNQYITKEVMFDEDTLAKLKELVDNIEVTNSTCISKSFKYDHITSCFMGTPLINDYNEYIGYKAVICNLEQIEGFEKEYKQGSFTPEVRLSNVDGDLYVTDRFYSKLEDRKSISKTIRLAEEGDVLTVCADTAEMLKYFYIYRTITLIVWTFLVLFLCKEIFTKMLTINKRFAYLSGAILFVIIGIEIFIYDTTIATIKREDTYMQAFICCYRDDIRLNAYNEFFYRMQRTINSTGEIGKVEGRPSAYLAQKYGALFQKFIVDDKYGTYVYIVDSDGTKVSLHDGPEINFKINKTWLNYNQYLYNSSYFETVEVPDLDTRFTVLGLPIVVNNEVKCVICFVYDLDRYIDDVYSLLSSMNNEKILIDTKGDATSLKDKNVATIEPMTAKGAKPYLSYAAIGQYNFIKELEYKYNKKVSNYYVFDSYFAEKRIVFLRDAKNKFEIEFLVLLITFGVESFLGICTHLFNRNVINNSKVNEGTKLAIQEKLKTFK